MYNVLLMLFVYCRMDDTPLLLACDEGHHDVAVMLISKGADINHVDEVSDTS